MKAQRAAAGFAALASILVSPSVGLAGEAEPGASPAPPVLEEVVVTATRGPRPLRDVPATVTVLPRAEIDRSPTKTVDELLRIVPSFGLFRRTSSVVADPTSQGVNLRGVGPSGVSRSLVLVDGVPENDPFGGWVYWRAIPRIGIGRIEVVPGGGSALYGNYALGGVTQVISRPISPGDAEARVEYGSLDTYLLSTRAADRWGPAGVVVEGELFKTHGHEVVADYHRGPIDKDAPSEHGALTARGELAVTPDLSLSLRGGYFDEDQNGGTRFTTAAVRRFTYAAGARYAAGEAGLVDLTLFGHTQTFRQERARIPAGRTTEFLAASQDVPSDDIGAGVVWTSRPASLAGTHTFSLGADARWIDGETREDLFPPVVTASSVLRRVAGGEQRLVGVFVQDVYEISPAVEVTAALRYDYWENVDASRFERLGSGATTAVGFPDRDDDEVSPKVGARIRPIDWLTLRASAYRAFRAPTLNELYRPFQVGQVRTEANEDLGPETLVGAEAGIEAAAPFGVTLRLTGFWNELDDPITNVTITPTARQRQNLGEARIQGAEVEAGWRIARLWLATAAYTYVDAEVTKAPGQPQLVGKALPQDPRHRAILSLTFDDPRLLTATAQARYLGPQFESDTNTLPMGGYAVVDLSASRMITRNIGIFIAAENLFDKTYLTGRPGVDTIGQPLFIHGGVRVRLGT